jgi:hypothetical protein
MRPGALGFYGQVLSGNLPGYLTFSYSIIIIIIIIIIFTIILELNWENRLRLLL